LEKEAKNLKRVVFCLYDDETYKIFEKTLEEVRAKK